MATRTLADARDKLGLECPSGDWKLDFNHVGLPDMGWIGRRRTIGAGTAEAVGPGVKVQGGAARPNDDRRWSAKRYATGTFYR